MSEKNMGHNQMNESELYGAMRQMFLTFLEDAFVHRYAGVAPRVSVKANKEAHEVSVVLACDEGDIATIATIPYSDVLSERAEWECFGAALIAIYAGDRICGEKDNPLRASEKTVGFKPDMGLYEAVCKAVLEN